MNNERLIVLANECTSYKEGLIEGKHDIEVFDKEKFAELIIQECIDIIGPYAVRMDDFDGGHPIADLKKHFGVQE